MPSDAPRMSKGRLAVIGPSGSRIARLRGPLIADCIARGIQVLALAPDMGAQGSSSLIALGAETKAFALDPGGLPLFRKARAAAALAQELRSWGATAVLAFGNGVTPLAVRAAKKARAQRTILIVSEIRDRKLPKDLAGALRKADTVIVHNRDDERIVGGMLAKSKTEVVRVTGAGAPVEGTEALELPAATGPLVFLAVARLDKIKGVADYLESARLARERGLDARFILAGPEGCEPGAVSADVLSRYAANVQYVGDQSDLLALFRDAHIFVSPSHCEGLPHAALQAMAAGRALVATDIPGARELVDENVNGTLVPPGEPAALCEAYLRLAKNRGLLPAMARASRAKAVRGYSAREVLRTLLEQLRLT